MNSHVSFFSELFPNTIPMDESDDKEYQSSEAESESSEEESQSSKKEYKEVELDLPCTMGNMVLLEKLGQGGYGVAYRAKNADIEDISGSVYVVKRNLAEVMSQGSKQKEFVTREIDIAKRIKNLLESDPNQSLLKLETLLPDTPENFYVAQVYEFCRKGDLFDLLKNRKGQLFDSTEIIKIARQLISALSLLHRHNIIHRDIGAPNIFVDSDINNEDTFKIGDYGLAKYCLSSGKDTPFEFQDTEYEAPEIRDGKPRSKATDVYAMGIIIIEVMMARVIEASEIEDCLNQISNNYKDLENLIQIVRSMIEPDQSKRPAIIQIEQQLNQYLAYLPVQKSKAFTSSLSAPNVAFSPITAAPFAPEPVPSFVPMQALPFAPTPTRLFAPEPVPAFAPMPPAQSYAPTPATQFIPEPVPSFAPFLTSPNLFQFPAYFSNQECNPLPDFPPVDHQLLELSDIVNCGISFPDGEPSELQVLKNMNTNTVENPVVCGISIMRPATPSQDHDLVVEERKEPFPSSFWKASQQQKKQDLGKKILKNSFWTGESDPEDDLEEEGAIELRVNTLLSQPRC